MNVDALVHDFVKYLRGLGYSEQTITGTIPRVRKLAALYTEGSTEPLPEHWKSYLKRIAAAGLGELSAYAEACLQRMERRSLTHGLRGGRKPKVRQKPARSVPDDLWPKLLAELAKDHGEDEPAATVLNLEATTGLRVGDVLRIPRADVLKQVPHGTLSLEQKGGGSRILYMTGNEAAWQRLVQVAKGSPKASNVAQCITDCDADSSSSGAAYKRCARLLSRIGKKLGIEGLHTHRLRRTVGVQALRLTGDVATVQQLLGQAPGSSATFSYLDEARPERVAEVATQIREKFGGGS